ncbi:MAG TPA: TIGR03085 family metal-binding protein [Nocardioides sp.]|nr:TIGR03085 family metal-binding protein [Nocardioides sp.]
MTSFARSERARLCDLALQVGPNAPTLCGEWTVRELVAHLVVREHSLLAAGIVVPPLAGLTDRQTARTAKRPLPELVRKVRRGITPLALPVVDQLVNSAEYFVHHEDIRRAAPSWEPRALSQADNEVLWRVVRTTGKGLARPAGVPVVARDAATGATTTLVGGDAPVTISGPPGELVLFLFGRSQLRGVELTGPPEAVDRLQRANLGI